MALADTARLIAALELQDKFSGPAKRAEGSLSNLDRKMGTLGQSGKRLGDGLGRAFSTIAKIGVGVGAAGVAALAVNIKAGVDSLNELEQVTTATNTVIKSTDGIAGQTAKGVRSLAEEYEDLNATMDDKVIQSGENLLLTFTNIRKQAFEPALEAALNMNEAMGGGPEGLQSTIIQVGKALNDPIKGVTALRRVGVQLSKSQEDQVKKLVEQNDLYGAQQIILGELTTEFGGRFAAAGQTAEGRMAKLADTIEDLQQRLAGPLIPVIDKVRDKLIGFLGSKQAQGLATDLGNAIAGIFTDENINKGVGFLKDTIQDIRRFLKGDGEDGGGLTNIASSIGTISSSVAGLPWESIGNAAKLLGTGSKALLDAFLGLPPWVQTAVLTGWGLNKLTGGALGGIVSELGKGLIKGVLGMNAGVVNINAATVNGPGGGVPTTGGGGRLGGFVGGVLGTAAIAAAIEGGFSKLNTQEDTITVGLRDGDISKIAEAIDFSPGALIGRATEDLLDGMGLIEKSQEKHAKIQEERLEEGNRYATNLNKIVEGGRTEANKYASELNREIQANAREARVDARTQATRLAEGNRYASTLNRTIEANAAADAARINSLRDSHQAALGTLQQIRDKKSSLTVNVQTSINATFSAGAAQVAVARYLDTTQYNRNLPDIT